jgi:ABC-type amino acid transport substrate-binding protein
VVLEDGQATGLNVELTRAFFNRLGYQLRFTTNIPFRRCLQWLKEGEIDVMAGSLGSEDRHRDFHMSLYDGHTVKTFFTQKNGPKINCFADLRGMNIVVVRGSKQFEQFGNMFTKTIVNSLVAAFGMLSKGRVDAVVSTADYGDNIIKNKPDYRAT